MRFLLNLVLLFTLTPLRLAQNIDSVWFPNDNFTLCSQTQQFQVSSVNRYFDVNTSTYKFDFISTSNITVTNLNKEGSTYSSSKMEIKFGFESFQTQPQQFCLDSVEGCPLLPETNFTIQRLYNLSHIPLYPLADITAQYSAIAADSTHLICIRFAPVGYQHPVWRKVFTWLPVSLTVSAAILSLISSFTIFHDTSQHDIFLFSSNYAMLPGVLRLKTPGFFDLIFYCQFIVTAGLFNIDYPRYHALFTSNFSWSFLLFDQSNWLNDVIAGLFITSNDSMTSVPGYSINKRQLIENATVIEDKVNVVGTGMSDFAIATGIDINALFFTMMVYLLIIIGSCFILCFFTSALFLIMGIFADNESYITKSKKMWDFTLGVFVRILSLVYLPMMILSFYQLMIPSYWYITLLAAIFVMAPFLFYGFIAIKLFQIRPASFIYTEHQLLLRFGSLYNTFTDTKLNFFISIIVYKTVTAAMIGLFQTSRLAQIILVLLSEISLLLIMLIQCPYRDTQVNFIHLIFAMIRVIVLSLNIAYLPHIQTTVISKQYIGYVQMAFHCLAFFLFLVLQIKNLVILATGLGDDELDESGKPPARMMMWRKRPPHQLHIHSSATLMSSSSGAPQSQSFYMTNSNRNSNRLTGDSQTFNNFYANNSSTTTALKPDEVRQANEKLVADYLNQSEGPSRVYRLDDEVVLSSEPLLVNSKAPPPLPKHIIFNNDSNYSPPHQPSPTSVLIQDDV